MDIYPHIEVLKIEERISFLKKLQETSENASPEEVRRRVNILSADLEYAFNLLIALVNQAGADDSRLRELERNE